MASTMFPSSAVGLPNTMKYDLPPSMSDSAKAYSVHVAPDGITSVVGPTPTSTAFVANSTGQFGAYTQQVVSFTIPSGMGDSVFLDPNSTTLSFSLTYTCSTSSSSTAGSINMIGSAASWFDQLQLYSNNVPIESIYQYGMLQNFLLNNTVSASERFGGISIAMGADNNSMNGIEIAHTSSANAYRYNFCIPLCSVIGYNSDKFIPIGSISNLQLQMTTAQMTPLVSFCSAVATQPVFTPFTLQDFQLNLKYVDVGDMAAALLRQTLQDGKWMLKATTYTNSNITIPSGAAGSQQLLLQIRNSSVKTILHQFGISPSAQCPNGYYDAVNLGCTVRQCQVGGQYFPNRPLNDLREPAVGYTYLIQGLGASIPKALGSSISRDAYNVVLATAPAGSDSSLVVPASGARPTAAGADSATTQISKYPNMFYCAYDLEKSSGVLFQGVNTRPAPPFLNLFLGQTTSSTIQCTAWGMSDVILVVDVPSKSVQAFV